MSLHPDAQQLIRRVEELSGRLVHVTEEPDLKVMATISIARGDTPAHFLRYRPGTRAVDYLVAHQLGFLVRQFSCPVGERWVVMSTAAEEQAGIEAMGLGGHPPDYARTMEARIVTQLRTYAVGIRVDDWIWKNLPDLRDQQEHSILSQLAENARSLAPEFRHKFPKPLVDANTTMNAAYAVTWGDVLQESRFTIPFKALGYGGKAAELLAIVRETPDDPRADRSLIERWAAIGFDLSAEYAEACRLHGNRQSDAG